MVAGRNGREAPMWQQELIMAARHDCLEFFQSYARANDGWQQVAHSYKFSDGAHGLEPLLHIADMIVAAQQPASLPRVLQVPKLKFTDRKP